MAPLLNPRHEQFARLVASGKSPTESFVSLGYSPANAGSCALRLSKKAEVRARILELQEIVVQVTSTQTALDRDSIRCRLRILAETAESESVRVRALELCGKDLGMFAGPAEVWDGDLSSLSDEQLNNLAKSLEKFADPAIVARAKRQLLLESGETIDTTAETVAKDEKDKW